MLFKMISSKTNHHLLFHLTLTSKQHYYANQHQPVTVVVNAVNMSSN